MNANMCLGLYFTKIRSAELGNPAVCQETINKLFGELQNTIFGTWQSRLVLRLLVGQMLLQFLHDELSVWH